MALPRYHIVHLVHLNTFRLRHSAFFYWLTEQAATVNTTSSVDFYAPQFYVIRGISLYVVITTYIVILPFYSVYSLSPDLNPLIDPPPTNHLRSEATV